MTAKSTSPMEPHALIRHVEILCASYRHWTGKYLVDPSLVGEAALRWLDVAPFALVSHGAQADPVFNYANRAALELFGMTWTEFTAMPSRLSAGPVERSERDSLLERVARDGYIDDYSGIRIAKGGRRFLIRNATVWNLLDANGLYYGQAAMIPEWEECSNA
jgi:hypothetical protein